MHRIWLFALLPGVAAASPMPQHQAPAVARQAGGQESDEIVVTGPRLRATKIDYRRKGATVTHCGARDGQQNPALVSAICSFMEACVVQGQRTPPALSDCVEARIAARERRSADPVDARDR